MINERHPARDGFDGEIHLPESIDREFLSAALQYAIENKVEFGMFRDDGKIILAFNGGDEEYMPSRWRDRRWHIGLEPHRDGGDDD